MNVIANQTPAMSAVFLLGLTWPPHVASHDAPYSDAPFLSALPIWRIASRHLVTAPSHRSCDLLLKATCGVTIAVVSSRERKRRQPGLATDAPEFVGWPQLVRGIQGSFVHFDFVSAA